MPYIVTTSPPRAGGGLVTMDRCCAACGGPLGQLPVFPLREAVLTHRADCPRSTWPWVDAVLDSEDEPMTRADFTTRYAVATLDEAQAAVRTEICDFHGGTGPDDPSVVATLDLPESGGTVGPLPDGTTIEVTWTTWDRLRDELRHAMQPLSYDIGHAAEAIIDAYNAAQA